VQRVFREVKGFGKIPRAVKQGCPDVSRAAEYSSDADSRVNPRV
tara:strand:+ start:428 stop:559 length:132 start_codon:yes stop_codon:yes gene_type:complete